MLPASDFFALLLGFGPPPGPPLPSLAESIGGGGAEPLLLAAADMAAHRGGDAKTAMCYAKALFFTTHRMPEVLCKLQL